MNTLQNKKGARAFAIPLTILMLLVFFSNIISLPVSADADQYELRKTANPERHSEYWGGRGIIVEDPDNPGNHVMLLKQKSIDDEFTVYTIDPIPVMPEEEYVVSWDVRLLEPDYSLAGFLIDVFAGEEILMRFYTYPEVINEWTTIEYPFPMLEGATHIQVHLLPVPLELDRHETSLGPFSPPEGQHSIAPTPYTAVTPTDIPGITATPTPYPSPNPGNTVMFDNIRICLPGSSGSIVPDWNFEGMITRNQ
jgi:hypothetical protein